MSNITAGSDELGSLSDRNRPITEARADEKIEAALKEAKDLKKDILTSFGIFAALLIFASLEVQILARVHRFSLLVGMSSFFAASMLLFAMGLHNVAIGRNEWSDFRKPIFGLIFFFMLFSFFCFGYALLCPPGWGLKILRLDGI